MARNLRFSEMSLEELLVEMHRMELIRKMTSMSMMRVTDIEIELHKHILCELRKPRIWNQRTFVPVLNVSYPNYCTTTVPK